MSRPTLRRLPLIFLTIAAPLFCASVALAQDPPPQQAAAAQPQLSQGQIDQLTASIALYPDPLLANVLMASTYPLEVVVASQWLDENKGMSGDALSKAAEKQSWDDSVKALINAPVVLTMMSKQIEWTNRLGETFLAQQADVIDSVQRLRRVAKDAGKLVSNDKQTVTVEGETIYIEPVQEVIYVPYYEPLDMYGGWMWDDYPPYYWYPPPRYGFAAGFFTAAIIYGIWSGKIDYPGHHINIDRNVEHWARRNGERGDAWRHDPEHRHGMNYSRGDLQQRFGKADLPGRDARRDFRGFEDHQRLDRSGDRRSVDRGSGFDGVNRGRETRSYSNRGYSSFGGRGGFGGMRGGFRGGGRR